MGINATQSQNNDSFTSSKHGGISKIDRYKWATDVGCPGEFERIDKNCLEVDKSYQRDYKESTVLTVAREFNWPAFGVIIVYKTLDGKLKIVDGQNRWTGAMRREDIHSVPCLVFPSKGTAEEALAFLKINTADKHRAQLKTGNAVALKVQKLINDSGRVVGNHTKGNTVRCLFRLTKLMENYEEDLNRVWPILIEASKGQPLYETVLDGLMYLERFSKQRISDKRWADRIIDIGAEDLHKAGVREASAFVRGGTRVWACGILRRLNKGLQHKLELKDIALVADD